MRKDLLGAKAYKVGYKLVGDLYYRYDIIKNFEKAIEKMKEYEAKGWKPIIKGIK